MSLGSRIIGVSETGCGAEWKNVNEIYTFRLSSALCATLHCFYFVTTSLQLTIYTTFMNVKKLEWKGKTFLSVMISFILLITEWKNRKESKRTTEKSMPLCIFILWHRFIMTLNSTCTIRLCLYIRQIL